MRRGKVIYSMFHHKRPIDMICLLVEWGCLVACYMSFVLDEPCNARGRRYFPTGRKGDIGFNLDLGGGLTTPFPLMNTVACTCTHAHTPTQTHTHTHTHILYIHTYIHTMSYIHTYIHAYIHTILTFKKHANFPISCPHIRESFA